MLESYQHAFRQMVTPVEPNHGKHAAEEIGLDHYADLTANWRKAVYQTNHREALLNALRQTYRHCITYFGEAICEILFSRYVASNPSHDESLNVYGQNLYLLNDSPDLFTFFAQLDWHIHQCYYAKNSQPFDFQGFSQLPETEQMSLPLGRTPSIFPLAVPMILSEGAAAQCLMAADMESREAYFEKQDDGHSQCHSAIHHYAIYRREGIPYIASITHSQFQLLESLGEKKSLTQLEQDKLDLESLPELLQLGWVINS